MDPELSVLQTSINGVGKILRESAQIKPAEFIAQGTYALGSMELFFGTPEGTQMNAATGRVLRAFMRLLLSQLEYVIELHDTGFSKVTEEERSEIGELVERAEEMVDSLGWVADEELNASLRGAASRAAT